MWSQCFQLSIVCQGILCGPHKWIPGVTLQELGPVTVEINKVIWTNGKGTSEAIFYNCTNSSDSIDMDTYPYSLSEDTTVSQNYN